MEGETAYPRAIPARRPPHAQPQMAPLTTTTHAAPRRIDAYSTVGLGWVLHRHGVRSVEVLSNCSVYAGTEQYHDPTR